MFLFYQQPKQLYLTTSARANMRLPCFKTLRSTELVSAQYCVVRYILLFRQCVHGEGSAYEACDLQWVWNHMQDHE